MYMRLIKPFVVLLVGMGMAVAGHAQKYTAGDKVKVQLNGNWEPAVIVDVASADNKNFRVKLQNTRGSKNAAMNTFLTVAIQNIKPDHTSTAVTNTNTVTGQQKAKAEPDNTLLGRYQIYTGIQKNYIGHFYLKADGTYRVALSSDEDTYAQGTYEVLPDEQTIKWLGGLFYHNRWGGKLVKQDNGHYQIIFNGKAMAEKSAE